MRPGTVNDTLAESVCEVTTMSCALLAEMRSDRKDVSFALTLARLSSENRRKESSNMAKTDEMKMMMMPAVALPGVGSPLRVFPTIFGYDYASARLVLFLFD